MTCRVFFASRYSSRSLSATYVPLSTGPARILSRSFSQRQHACAAPTLPRILDIELWKSIMPRRHQQQQQQHQQQQAQTGGDSGPTALAQHGSTEHTTRRQHSHTSNSNNDDGSVFYMIIALLIGSQAIHQLMLEARAADFRRGADAKIKMLRELVERLRRGEGAEEIDVRKVLGTGEEEKEREWEEVLQEIEREDSRWKAQRDGHGNGQKPNNNNSQGDPEPEHGPSSTDGASTSSSPQTTAASESSPSTPPPARFF